MAVIKPATYVSAAAFKTWLTPRISSSDWMMPVCASSCFARAETQWQVVLGILHGVTQFVRGNRDGSDRWAVGNSIRKEQGLVARIIMIGEFTSHALDLYAV